MILFDASTKQSLGTWVVVDDIVMGGQSQGHFQYDDTHVGIFSGVVSLENNGGFSSLQYTFPQIAVNNYQKITLRLRGDGKDYQLRLQATTAERHTYKVSFSTSGDWQDLSFDFSNFQAVFRGRSLPLPHYPGQSMSSIRFLIANKRAENFRLILDRITLEA